MATIQVTLRLQEAVWDFGGDIGQQAVMCYHQFLDSNGEVLEDLTDPTGVWTPFIPGPVLRGRVDDVLEVTIQNRMGQPDNPNFVKELKTDTIVHWHGVEMGNAYDGTPVTQKPFPHGTDFTYRLKLFRPGMFWYHPHWDSLIQSPLGAYGPIIVESPAYDDLRAANVIPHADRTFNVSLSDVSFQSDREVAPPGPHVPIANLAGQGPGQVFIRNVHHIQGAPDENFGDGMLVNGLHAGDAHLTAFNQANGNFQQNGTTAPILAHEDESFAFYIVNSGIHRFYRVSLAFRTTPGGAWQTSPNLFKLGGEAGLLNAALAGAGAGPNAVQSSAQLGAGEWLIPTSSRVLVAFRVEPGWVEVALRVSGFDLQVNAAADVDPTDQIIAHFDVGQSPNPDFVLTDATTGTPTPVGDGTLLLAHAESSEPELEDLTDPAITALTGLDNDCADSLAGNGVITPPGVIETVYDPDLTPGPAIDNVPNVAFNADGPDQPTFDNTRYVRIGDVVEWHVGNTTGNDHPWHMHGFSFQPVRMEDAGGALVYEWNHVEYVDAIHIPSGHRLVYRFRVEDRVYVDENGVEHANGVIGRWLAHCHINKHAHNGMLMNFFVVDADCDTNERQFADVYLRDHPDDVGDEPWPGSISASPDIILQKFQLADPQGAFGHGSGTESDPNLGKEAEFGQDNFIYVRHSNRGSRVARARTDVYWALPSTLLTPDQWNYIGETEEVVVEPGELIVSDALTWNEADIPDPDDGPSHFCFVGIAGSPSDPKTMSLDQVQTFAQTFTWDEFRDLIRKNNNVTWRNFNVVDDLLNLKANFVDFRFVGAFDADRRFDIVIENPVGELEVRFPNAPGLSDALKGHVRELRVDGNQIVARLPAKSTVRLANLILEKGRHYVSRIMLNGLTREDVGKTIAVVQEYVEDYQAIIARLKLESARLAARLAQGDLDAAGEAQIKAALEKLQAERARAEDLAAKPDEADRVEVGRVSWHFAEPAEEEKPHGVIACIIAWLKRLFCRLFGWIWR